jgi:hypothetical protein
MKSAVMICNDTPPLAVQPAGSAVRHAQPSLEWAAKLTHGELFDSGAWFSHFAATALAPGTPLHIVQTAPGPESHQLTLPMIASVGTTWPRCRLLDAMANYYSCDFGPIATGPTAPAALVALADSLADAGRGFDGIRLGPMDRNSGFASSCDAQLRAHGFGVFWTLAHRNWYADTSGLDYAQYLARVPSSFPSTSQKRRQAFLKKGTGSIAITQSEQGLDEAIAAYTSVYAASWKVPEPFPHFMPGLIRLAAREGWLRLGVLRIGDEPAAVQLWFVVAGRALIYKVAYAAKFEKLSVGSILTCALIDHVISVDRVRELDFLSGDDAYKAKWMFARRDRHTLVAFNRRRWRGLLASVREAIAQRRDERAQTAR